MQSLKPRMPGWEVQGNRNEQAAPPCEGNRDAPSGSQASNVAALSEFGWQGGEKLQTACTVALQEKLAHRCDESSVAVNLELCSCQKNSFVSGKINFMGYSVNRGVTLASFARASPRSGPTRAKLGCVAACTYAGDSRKHV